MSRTNLLFAGLLLGASSFASAQNAAQPVNVVTPAPAPREGTVGPEQLRDFSLPGTRRPVPAPPAETPRTAAPAPAANPPAARSAPATATRTEPGVESRPAPGEQRPVAAPAAERAAPSFSAPAATPAEELPVPVAQEDEPLPPIVVTQPTATSGALLPGWWPWVLVAILGGAGLALALRQRRRPAPAGYRETSVDRGVPEAAEPVPRPASPPPPRVVPQAAPPLPSGLVTTRLRQPTPEPAAPRPAPPPVSGGVVSRRLRGWIELDLAIREILFDAQEALIRIELIVANKGTAAAREIAIEALATNAGEEQARELATFFERPAPATIAILELGPLGETILSLELRMPRTAIRAYEAQGRTLFVPLIAINAAYRTASLEARTGAALLVGREVAGSEKLAPLQIPTGPGRQLGLGVRRLDEAVRR